ncbi:PREDICTED: hyphally regulated cell wall protein 3-like [Diuraphis noxia]|uniref:hyphally regulated cell wall protein 3-like n=1 Tax=Diuraphis noxia TaxID=143948 RepID=UPI00076360FC|nr:PREDICTED: hyphally regulated cell wall protein 3-like [Diuraphis noxia]XP_015368500.1 PREDICTED: hyphally regulated cell wall protein 3-like [Diuraphis noxia]XP_015368501.1 PREDICTED: hyphally regulated cell wall protein 3-like [Diuraphis noxia]
MTKVSTASNKSLHLTGIGLAVQAFYINLTLDTVMGGDFIQLKPAGPPIINPAGVWSVDQVPQGYATAGSNLALNGLQALQAFGGNKIDANGYRDQNGFYRDNNGALNGYDVGNTYGGVNDRGVTSVEGGAYGGINGRNKGHQVAGFSTSYQKNESGNKATYYDDGLGHGGVIQYGAKDQRFRDGEGKAFGGGYHDSSVKTNAVGQQGQYGNGDGYHAAGGQTGDAVNNQLYGTRSDSGPGIVAGTPFLVSTTDPLPPVVHLPPQYVQQSPQYIPQAPQYVPQAPYVPQAQYVPQAPYIPQAPFAAQAPGLFQNNIPQLPPIIQQQPGSILPPYNVQLPALSLSARSPSGQYVVPMPPKLYVDKPNATTDG